MRKLFTLQKFFTVLVCLILCGVESTFAVGDAGVQNIIGPVTPVCKGVSPVTVIVHNYGGITISTATIHWQVNGVNQPNFSYTGNILAGSDDTVTIGTYNFATGPYSVVAFTRNPNGSADSDPANDSAMVNISVSTKLTGTYTIAGATPDFATVGSAVSSLIANGVCGPVIFNIRPHTDTMQCVITPIAGADSTNTITFQSANGDSSSVILTYPSQDTLINNHLISLQGADYITFKSITMERTGIKANAHVLEFTNNATHNTVTNCRLLGGTGPTTNSLAAILYSSNATTFNDSANTFTNNLIKNGSLGIYMNGVNTLALEFDIVIKNNIFQDQTFKGIQNSNQANILIEGNTFTTNSTNPAYTAIYLDRSNRVQHILKNKINNVAGTGMYFVDCTAQAGIHGVIANNFVVSKDTAAIHMINSDYEDIVFNTVQMSGSDASFTALMMRGSGAGKFVKNNILYNSGSGFCYTVSDSAVFSIQTSNFNNLFKTGAFVGKYNGTNCANIAAWIAASNKDSNSVSINPAFVSANDLHCTSQAMDDLGTHVNNVSDDIDGQARAAVTPDIGADEYSSVARNVGIGGFIVPVDSTCGSATTSIQVIITNTGGNPESGFNVAAQVSGSLVTVRNFMHSTVLAPGTSDTITFTPIINTAAGGTYTIKVFTELGVDQVHANDTLTQTFRLFAPPANPVTTGASICGPGTDTLTATSADTISWYSAPTGGTLLATGPTYIPPVVNSNTTYYVSAKSVCEGPRNGVTLTVLPVPNVSLGNDTSINQGNSVILNAGTFSGYLWSPGGQTTQTINVNTTGCYNVRVTNGSGCTDRDTLCVTVLQPSDVGITSFTTPVNQACADDSMQVLVHVTNLGSDTAAQIPITVDITGDVTASFNDTINNPLTPGQEVVVNLGIISLPLGGTIVVTAYTSYSNDLDHTNDTLISSDTIVTQPLSPSGISSARCGPGIIVIIAMSPDSVHWYDAASGGNLLFVGDNFVIPNLASTTTYYAQTGDVCVGQTRTPVNATIFPLPTVDLGADTTAVDSLILDAGTFASYQWSTNETTQMITVFNSGPYSVCVSDANGCSNCDTIDIGIFIGIEQISTVSNVNVYPNPAHSYFTIDLKEQVKGNVTLQIVSAQGQIIWFEAADNFSGKTFNVSSFAKGIYFLKVQTDDGLSVHRLIIE